MTTNLTWKAPPLTTCLHVADGLSRGLIAVDPQLGEAVAEPVARVRSAVEASGVPPGRMWRLLAGLSGQGCSAAQIAETAVLKTVGPVDRLDAFVSYLAGALTDVQVAMRGVLPNMTDELALRERPLREQWEARGPGLLFQIAALTEQELLPEHADVLLVHPAFGGAGTAHLAQNSVRIEAVLANPHEELPEIVRLAWLIAQLQLDLPVHGEHVNADRLPHVARLALLPAALQAAETVELVRRSPQLLQLAMRAWHLSVPAGTDIVGLVTDWWETYQASRPPFRVALQALDQMLG
jgi:hypothetical protein